MIKNIIVLITVIGLQSTFLIRAAIADDSTQVTPASVQNRVAQLKKDCAKDVSKFCKDITPGEGRIADCMSSREDQLSASCKSSWDSTQARISEKMDQGELAFRTNCGGDVQKFCADTPSGRGRLLDCLGKHEDGLSNSCKSLQTALEKKLSEFFG
jgi:hypothetical protein